MADTTLLPDSVHANPNGLIADEQTATRRNFITAFAGGVLLSGLTPAPAAAKSGAWSNSIARYLRATSALSAAVSAHDDAEEVYFDRKPQRPTFTMEIEGDYGRLGKHVLPITIYHEELDNPDKTWADPDRIAEMRAELHAFRAADAALRRDLDLDRLDAVRGVRCSQQDRALRQLLATPAPDMHALAEKLRIVLKEFDDADGTTGAVLADVLRLAGEARA